MMICVRICFFPRATYPFFVKINLVILAWNCHPFSPRQKMAKMFQKRVLDGNMFNTNVWCVRVFTRVCTARGYSLWSCLNHDCQIPTPSYQIPQIEKQIRVLELQIAITKSRLTNFSVLELIHQEQTNSSIAWKIEIHNSYFVKISTKKVNLGKLMALGLTIHAVKVFELAKEQVISWGLTTSFFGIPELSTTGWYKVTASIQPFFLHILSFIVFALNT